MVQKELRKFSQWFWKGFFEMVWWRGRKWNHIEKDFWSWSVFLLPNVNFPFIWRDFWRFPFSFLSLFFSAPSLEDLRVFDDVWGENHFFKNFLSNGFNIMAVDAYFRVELCTPTWLNHDYGDGGVVNILAVDTYSRVDVCTPIFMGEASN
jgi:hypothetical protein